MSEFGQGQHNTARYCRTHEDWWWGPLPLEPRSEDCDFMEFRRSLADDPAAVERGAKEMFDRFKHLLDLGEMPWTDPSMQHHRKYWIEWTEAVLRAAETGEQ